MRGNDLGVGPIGWVNDDLRDWGADRQGVDVLREISELGFHGTEMSYRFPLDPGGTRPGAGCRLPLDQLHGARIP